MADNDWTPRTRDDYVGLFKDGILGALAEDREAEAKARQAAGKEEPKEEDKEPKSKGVANWLLGNK